MPIEYRGKVFLAPNTSDEEIVNKAKKKLVENGIKAEHIQINYNIQDLEVGDIYVSYEPPDLVVRNVYDKKASGITKMKSSGMIQI
jgi:hypothetical protein